jgi:tripartite-type tricarboxylate transporter receptor subunit TctC
MMRAFTAGSASTFHTTAAKRLMISGGVARLAKKAVQDRTAKLGTPPLLAPWAAQDFQLMLALRGAPLPRCWNGTATPRRDKARTARSGGTMTTTRRHLLLAMPALALAAPARAAAWPERPVRIVVSFTAGGTTDIIARLVGNHLSEKWGQPVVIENRPGAGGNIGTEYVVRSAPDGYTLLVGSVGPLAVNQSLYRTMPYDTRKDVAAVSLLAGVPNILVVAPDFPARDVAELVKLAKEKPGALSYGSTGVGTSSHLSGALMDQMAGIQTTHVPYRGAVALNDLLSRRLDFMFATIPSVIEQIRAGKLRPMAVSSLQRSRSAPDVPAMAELGFPGFDASSWFGMVAPANTPREIVSKISGDVAAILRRPDIEKQMVEQGADPVGNTPAEFAAYINAEITRWATVVRLSGATVE